MIALVSSGEFNSTEPGTYDLQSQVFDTVCQTTRKKGIVSAELLDKLGVASSGTVSAAQLHEERAQWTEQKAGGNRQSLKQDAEGLTSPNLLNYAILFRAAKDKDQQQEYFNKLKKNLNNEADRKPLADLMSLLVPALNAANAVKQWAGSQPNKESKIIVDKEGDFGEKGEVILPQKKTLPESDPKRIFTKYFLAGLRVDKSGKNTFGMTPEQWLDSAIAVKQKMILALCNTCHPTNFYSDAGRDYQKDLNEAMHNAKLGFSGRLNEEGLAGIAGAVADACDMMNGIHPKTRAKTEKKHITFLRQVTVAEEQATEWIDVLPAQKIAKKAVLDKWNEAVEQTKKSLGKLLPGFKEKLDGLLLSDKDKDRVFEMHSWNYGTADGDGRHLATDTAMYKGYRDALNEQGDYKGPIMDCRQNGEERKKVIGALIADEFKINRSGKFREQCKTFNTDENTRLRYGGKKKLGEHFKADNEHSVFQWLSEKNQTAFLLYLMDNNINLPGLEKLQDETVKFNEKYFEVMGKLLKENDGIGYRIDPDNNPKVGAYTPFSELINYPAPNGSTAPSLQDVFLARMGQKGPEDAGFTITRVQAELKGKEPEDQPVVGFIYHRKGADYPVLGTRFIKNTAFNPKKPIEHYDEKKETNCLAKPLGHFGAMTGFAQLRRLSLLNYFHDEQHKNGRNIDVARVEETANFEQPSDFFTQLYLFKQAGLVTLGKENGKTVVTEKPKVGICPLLETTKDVRNGIRILKAVLATDLGKSYYRKRECAELFVGYSDGSKSGGNFAAHFLIRKFKKEAIELFKDTFKNEIPDFPVVVKHGTGRGENRGGMRHYDRQYRMHHDKSNESAYNYQTIQGDHMIRMQMDQQYAERSMAELYVSTVAGAVEAQRPKSKLEKKRNDSFEAAMSYIADASEEAYQRDVYTQDKAATGMLDSIYKNAEASSRSAVRPDTAQSTVGAQRAIPVEMAAFISQLPFHDYGLHTALKKYAAAGEEAPGVLDKTGETMLHGLDALKVLAQDCDFFREEMKLAMARQQGYKPAISQIWEEKAIAQAKEENKKGQAAFFKNIHQDLNGLDKFCQSLLTGEDRKKVNVPTREDYTGEPLTNALGDIAQAIFAQIETVKDKMTKEGKKLANIVYFTAMAPGTERPSGLMRSRHTPGLSDSQDQFNYIHAGNVRA